MKNRPNEFTFLEKALAWSVHIFTASGILTGFMALLAIQAHEWRAAMLWLMAGLIIDGVDGTLARRFKVGEVLPEMNGKTMDYVIDFATYAIIPAYFFYEAALAEGPWRLVAAFLMLIAGTLYYGREGMVSDDKYFVGFPVLWNIVVFYLFFVFDFPAWGNVLVIIIFSILHFVPLKFPYPSQQARWRKMTLFLSGVFGLAMLAVVWWYPDRNLLLNWVAIFSGAYFLVLGFLERKA